MRFLSVLLSGLALCNTAWAAPASSATITNSTAADEYVVLMDNTAENRASVKDILHRLELTPEHEDVLQVFENKAFTGFVARMGKESVDKLNGMTEVSSMGRDVEVSSYASARLQAPWGLERVSSTKAVAGDTTKLDFTYSYQDSRLGDGVDIYIIDTGVQASHDAFGGRAVMGFSVTSSMSDGEGHGTHVAGTAAGIIVGTSSKANLIGVKVLDDNGAGTTSSTIRGIDFALQNHEKRKKSSGFIGTVLNLSLGLESRNSVLEAALTAAANSGIHVSVAAGNAGQDACNYAPGAAGGSKGPLITVGAIGASNVVSTFSNYGPCVDVYAPGENIISSWVGASNNLINILDGTSMACPHVTGVIAYNMVLYPELADNPSGMKSFLASTAHTGLISSPSGKSALQGDKLLMVSNGFDGGPIQALANTVKTVVSKTVKVTRRDNSIMGRMRRAAVEMRRRWISIDGPTPVSTSKREADTIEFELISDKSELRY